MSQLKINYMKLSIKELNDIYYCIGRIKMIEGKLIDGEDLTQLQDKIGDYITKEANKWLKEELSK